MKLEKMIDFPRYYDQGMWRPRNSTSQRDQQSYINMTRLVVVE